MTRPAAASRRRDSLLKLLVLALGLAAAGWLLRTLGVAPGTAWADQYLAGGGVLAEILFVAVGTLASAVGVPRQAVAFVGGYAFGAVAGSALALAAQVVGAALAFGWARLIGKAWAERRLAGRFGPRIRPLRDTLVNNPFGATLALRLLPIGNNLALNLLAGMAGIAAGPFLVASAIGYLPQTVIFALLGKGVRVDGVWQMALAAALFVIAAVIGFWLLQRHRAGRVMED
ncbi:TVP38/TMEM64 family protein [Humitalea sp. 24SJ18S-53]|uniref:TVP38/TMEM64 family protein n=1 Tax=Humitalea sp. 24SJ18S-53 TaxID=3422307 RepID=UPI003D66BD9E